MSRSNPIKRKAVFSIIFISLGLFLLYIYFIKDTPVEHISKEDAAAAYDQEHTDDPEAIVNGIHVSTGLVDAPGLKETVANCTTCHSSKLIIQNRMTKEQWNATIKWMQETQGLWPLGDDQDVIVNYLTTNYPPFKKSRRAALTDTDWYVLKDGKR